ncbi:AlbA family DNA-binding domain-containing protein [Winogradskyella tangerina]|uniref:AlbA family DNA-binding domain-containing protein n=1 Tax=Winogradskyella tangerina TaxID=2023240 RepID=UPI000DBE10F6|nr:ATP-binding protein [Winogradskyella tangerina]
MTELHKLKTYDINTVESFIFNEIEESIHIEFKAAGALSKTDSIKKEVSKDVSAFANSDGGIIIYGIEEKNHKAHKFSFIDGNEFTKEWLEQIISSTINRNIPGLKIFPIRKQNEIKKTIYVVQIPSSIEAPHICKDKRYYKRYNFESVAMEEYEIRELYGRRVRSKLVLDKTTLTKTKENANEEEIQYGIEVDIYNEGEKMEENYKVNVYFINSPKSMRVLQHKNKSNSLINFTRIDNNKFKASVNGFSPIYPNELLNVVRIDFTVHPMDLPQVFDNLKLEVRLYYPNGEDYLESNLGKTIKEFEEG